MKDTGRTKLCGRFSIIFKALNLLFREILFLAIHGPSSDIGEPALLSSRPKPTASPRSVRVRVILTCEPLGGRTTE